MGATPIIDMHMHIYPSREYGLSRKSTYQVWEYGEKPDTPFSRYSGDVEDALDAIRRSPVDRAVVVNLFAVSMVGEYIAKIFEEVKRRPHFIRRGFIRDGEIRHAVEGDVSFLQSG